MNKKIWIIIVLIILVIIAVFSFSNKKEITNYETIEVLRGDLIQTVDATGEIKSQNDLSLNFEISGIIDNIYAVEGEEVFRNDILANLELQDLDLAIEQARANLNQAKAGATPEAIDVSQKQISAAELTLQKAELNLENVTNLADENLKTKYVSLLDLLDDSYIKIHDAYNLVNDIKEEYFNTSDQYSIKVKDSLMFKIQDPMEDAESYLNTAKNTQNIEDVKSAITAMDEALNSVLEGLIAVRNICDSTQYQNVVTSADKTLLDQSKTLISAGQIALTNAQNEVALLIIQNKSNVDAAQLARDEAQANLELQQAKYESLIADPREVDLAYLEYVLAQAQSNRNKAIIRSPINGIITKINKEEGELISTAESLFNILSPNYQIEVNIPETDIVKISVGDIVSIDLDAFENGDLLEGEVISIDSSSTNISDVVYYRVIISIEENEDIKPGMTADIVINTNQREDVLYLPSRAILSDNGRRYVRVLENGEIVEKDVEIGLHADDSKREVISGVKEGDEIVLKILD
jgi:RND family efflux transporter MFP subunit